MYEYYIHLSNGMFAGATVEDQNGNEVFDIVDYDHLVDIIACGYMTDARDIEGLLKYMVLMNIVPDTAVITQ